MTSRVRSLATGIAAASLLVLIVVGLPVVLLRFGGSPVPSHFADWQRIKAWLSAQDNGALLLPVIRDCSWLAWLLFTVCVAAEAQALARGRKSPSLRLGSLQGLVGQLVALAALTFATTPTAVTLSAASVPVGGQLAGPQQLTAQVAGRHDVPLASLLSPEDTPHGTRMEPAPATRPSRYLSSPPASTGHDGAGSDRAESTAVPRLFSVDAGAAHSTQLITVRPGDCLWSIAQRVLGSGDRYPEIAQLNYGRRMGDGQVFRDPGFIEPGWRLILPDVLVASSRDAQPGPEASQGNDPGTAASSHDGHPAADQRYRLPHQAAVRPAPHVHADSSRAGNGRSGATAVPRSPRSATSALPSADTGTRSRPETGAVERTATRGSEVATAMPAAAFFGTGLLAGAALATLGRLRRRQRQERRRGRRIALPADPQVLATEQRLRAAATGGSPDAVAALPPSPLRAALAVLEAGLAASLVPPEIVALHVTPDVLEVLLAAPAAEGPPEPYLVTPGRQGMCWHLGLPMAARAQGPGAESQVCHLLPGLLTAGTTGDGYLLVDLESLRVTGCDGPPELVDRVIATAATELATGQWSGWYDLILVGCDELAVLGRADVCPTLGEALDVLEDRVRAVRHRLADRQQADLRQLRLSAPDDEDWGLTILVSRTEPSPQQTQRLLRLAEDGPGGVAALVAGDPEDPDGRMAPAVLQLAPDPAATGGMIANVVPLQLTVRPRALAAADYEAISTLFAVANQTTDVSDEAEPYVAYGAPPWIPQAATLEPSDEAVVAPDGEADASDPESARRAGQDFWQADPGVADSVLSALPEPGDRSDRAPGSQLLRVRVLGPFAVTGTTEQLQPKQAELVLALALSAPSGLSNSALCSMLGADPDHPKPSDAVRQLITRTRRKLGQATDGREYIIHTGNGHYLLHPDVQLDWTEFRALADSGGADDLRHAVSLVAGQPFTGSYHWWIDIPLVETVRAEVVDAADMLAEYELTAGSPRASARAARAGLLADPSAEQLWRAVMRAEHAGGNIASLTEAWRCCLDAIEDIAPGGEPHPETVRLYRTLSSGASRPAAARPG